MQSSNANNVRRGIDLSVIVCTRNNAARLELTLDAISRCRIPCGVTFELIVVNNNSTDDTDKVVNAWRGRLPIVYIEEKQDGQNHARNAGICVARGKLVVFTDDDVR